MPALSYIDSYFQEALALLSSLIRAESLSGQEDKTAAIIQDFFSSKEINYKRSGNNIWAKNEHFDSAKKTILLNSHHDTVKPNKGYSNDPFEPIIDHEKLYGLGSNDAGGSLVSLIQVFKHFHKKKLPYNLIFAATAEEENSGKGGIESILNELEPIDFAIVGEPTEMKMAVAEKGLMVLDCKVQGESGHSARDQGVNAIYEAIHAIEWFKNYKFEKESNFLGPIKMTVTMINAGYQHNVIPDNCDFVVDVRTTDAYTNEEVLKIIKEHVDCEVQARSTRLKPSRLPEEMPIYMTAKGLGIAQYGSPTMSDQALMNFSSLKMGPGKSERSHTADEFIFLKEIAEGIEGYITLLEKLFEEK